MKIKLWLLVVILAYPVKFQKLYSQNDLSDSHSQFTYGIAVKLNVELSHKYSPDMKLSITGGIGNVFEKIKFMPTLNSGLLLFNSGTIGANQSKSWYKTQIHGFVSFTGTVQLDIRDYSNLKRFVPLYHFSEFTANPLQNPFKTSFSYGMNKVFVQGATQRIGFFNLNVLGRGQISYYNDGGPILSWAGDNRDRYYTGGVVLSYHGNINDFINLIELSYHKYTGYQEYAFDIADKLQVDFLNYNDTNQFAYNQQRWRLNFSNLKNGFGGSISIYNMNKLDLQDFLHFTTNVPYHPNYYSRYRWMFGARYEYNNTSLSQ